MAIEFVAFAFAFASAVPAEQPASKSEQQLTIISTVWAKPDKCNSSIASHVEFSALAEEPRRWTGKCVAVDGFWRHRALFATRTDAQKGYTQSAATDRQRRIGIYGKEELLASAPTKPSAYTAVGLVGQCEELGKGAVLVSGYCHYFFGPYIAVAEMLRR
jgi:hypothetical protein